MNTLQSAVQQVVKVIWYKMASPPQTDGSIVFVRWRQCAHWGGTLAPPDEYDWTCTSFCTTSTTQTANRSVQPFLHSSRQSVPILYNRGPFHPKLPFSWGHRDHHLFHDSLRKTEPTIQTASRSVQLFSHMWPQSVPILYNGCPLSPKIAHSHGDLDPHIRHNRLNPSEPTDQTASLSVQPFLHRWLQNVPILYNGTPLSPSKLPIPMGGSGPPSNTWFPGPTRVLNPNGISIASAILAGLTSVKDHATRSVTIDRIYVRSTVMQSKKWKVQNAAKTDAVIKLWTNASDAYMYRSLCLRSQNRLNFSLWRYA